LKGAGLWPDGEEGEEGEHVVWWHSGRKKGVSRPFKSWEDCYWKEKGREGAGALKKRGAKEGD